MLAFLFSTEPASSGEIVGKAQSQTQGERIPFLWAKILPMEKQAIFGASAPVAGAPYTPAVRVGNLLFISGQLGLDPETKKPFESFEAQVEGAMAGIRGLVEAAGGSLDNLVKTTIFLSGDMGHFAELNALYSKHFGDSIKPARSTFAVAALPLGALVEIEAIASL